GAVHPLSDATVRRISNQIARACRGTYGARTGLRTIVKSVARQMLRAGSSPEVVALAFANVVVNHPAYVVADPQNVITGQRHSRMLVDLTRECIDVVALEPT